MRDEERRELGHQRHIGRLANLRMCNAASFALRPAIWPAVALFRRVDFRQAARLALFLQQFRHQESDFDRLFGG